MSMNESITILNAIGAGRWFPGTRQELTRCVTGHLDAATPPRLDKRIISLVSPHAGYAYSGPVAAYAYRALQDQSASAGSPETVIVLGFSHQGAGRGIALMEGNAFATPLGTTPLDHQAAAFLIAHHAATAFDNRPHLGEHSLENQIPFIQQTLPAASLVMALVATRDPGVLESFAESLLALARSRRILVIASSDMLHDASYERVRTTDQATLRRMVAMDHPGLLKEWDVNRQILCGIGPTVVALAFARGQGTTQGTLLHYRNSGDDHPECRGQWVVGYGAVAYTAP